MWLTVTEHARACGGKHAVREEPAVAARHRDVPPGAGRVHRHSRPPGLRDRSGRRDAGSGSAAPGGRQGSSAVRHVWVIELENQGYAQSSADPYLARTLPRLLRTIEDSFGLPHLGDAAMPRSGPSAPTCPASRHRLNPAPGPVRRQQPRQRPGNASAVRRRSGATVPDRQCLADRRQLRRVHLLRAAEPQFRGVPRLVLPVHCRQRLPGAELGSAGSPPCSCTEAGTTSSATCCSCRSSERTSRTPSVAAVPRLLFAAMLMQTGMTLLFGAAQDARVPELGAAVLSPPCWAPTSSSTPLPGPHVIFPVFLVRIPAWIFLGLWFLYQHRGDLRAVQRQGERRRRRVLRPRRRVHLRPAGSTTVCCPGGTGRTRGAMALDHIAPRDPSLAATEEARRRPRRCALVPYQV